MSLNLPTPSSTLSVSAHPDDTEFGCGATLARWAAAGCVVHLAVCTDGSKGSWDPQTDAARLVVRRQDEQREAARRLGASGEVVFLGYTDGELQADLGARALLASWIRRLRPAVVLGHDPWKRYRIHPDHRQAGLLVTEAVVAARDPHFFAEQNLPAHRPEHLLLFEADEPDHYEDADGWADAKIAALEAHESQFESTMGIEAGDDGTQRGAFRQRIHRELAEAGAPAGLATAEAFKLLSDL
ncbi:MAG: PIG-L family deacetylase [bacterium]|nr:PIG-L family deacetylase [bacterium]MCY3953634.1 PIG-L family deacetylase [bacterium]MCY4104034.1 PIG-L family deacetylase [bacterium]